MLLDICFNLYELVLPKVLKVENSALSLYQMVKPSAGTRQVREHYFGDINVICLVSYTFLAAGVILQGGTGVAFNVGLTCGTQGTSQGTSNATAGGTVTGGTLECTENTFLEDISAINGFSFEHIFCIFLWTDVTDQFYNACAMSFFWLFLTCLFEGGLNFYSLITMFPICLVLWLIAQPSEIRYPRNKCARFGFLSSLQIGLLVFFGPNLIVCRAIFYSFGKYVLKLEHLETQSLIDFVLSDFRKTIVVSQSEDLKEKGKHPHERFWNKICCKSVDNTPKLPMHAAQNAMGDAQL